MIKSLHSFSRSESEIETAQDREREVKMKKNSREFSRNENLAGLCMVNKFFVKNCQIIDSFQISKLRPGQISASSVA